MKMKKVRFGENKIKIIENISKYLLWEKSLMTDIKLASEILYSLKDMYVENPNFDIIYKTCDMISEHEDLYHVDLYFNKNNTDIFFNHIKQCIEFVFGFSKHGLNIIESKRNILYFKDGFSNPSLSLDDFLIKENWEI